jgi:hypothetical protein
VELKATQGPIHRAPGHQLHITDNFTLIDDEKLIAGQQLLKTHQMLLVAGLDQFADQRRGSRKADTVAALTGRQAEGQRKVSLPGSTRY